MVGDCLQDAIDSLSSAGVKLIEQRPDIDFIRGYEVYAKLLHAVTAMALSDDAYKSFQERLALLEDGDKSSKALQARGICISHREWLALDQERLLMRQKWADFFKERDCLLT